MGGCWPGALEELGAPNNDRLRRYDGLHAKVYISDKGMVVGSPNASANGIGFQNRNPVWLEAGTFHPGKSEAWHEAIKWFDQIYRNANKVDDAALAEAQRLYQRTPGQWVLPVREGSILDLVRECPKQFGPIGFVFANLASTKEEKLQARRILKTQAGVQAKDIDDLPDEGIFTGWDKEELGRWPASFIEFWISSRGNLYVCGRRVRFFEPNTGSVFTIKSWSAVRSFLPSGAPKAKAIAEADADVATAILGKSGRGVLYSSPATLSDALLQGWSSLMR
ncbi:hypothetical protein GALL_529310 [mine drainage metagenome]|uniref:PLD phosphodiesterase domain-containing protein n=1 Tax=mine drainage metagenome TaxID=410659 RepID=A0A1J5PPM6_9ZZZZ